MTRKPSVVLGAGVALVLGIGIGMALDSDGSTSSVVAAAAPGPVDVGFSQDMVVHHEQAVLMAQLVRDRTEDPKVAALATGIINDQLLDVGAMRGYLMLWQAPMLPAGPPMTWMSGHDRAGTTMPGMATVAELNALRTAEGAALDRMFLQLMLRHHDGGLTMVDDAAARAEIPAVRSLAARIAFHQREENRTINALLAAQG